MVSANLLAVGFPAVSNFLVINFNIKNYEKKKKKNSTFSSSFSSWWSKLLNYGKKTNLS